MGAGLLLERVVVLQNFVLHQRGARQDLAEWRTPPNHGLGCERSGSILFF